MCHWKISQLHCLSIILFSVLVISEVTRAVVVTHLICMLTVIKVLLFIQVKLSLRLNFLFQERLGQEGSRGIPLCSHCYHLKWLQHFMNIKKKIIHHHSKVLGLSQGRQRWCGSTKERDMKGLVVSNMSLKAAEENRLGIYLDLMNL